MEKEKEGTLSTLTATDDIEENAVDATDEAETREELLIKAQFFEEVCELQKPDKIETRAILRDQLQSLIKMLESADNTKKSYYYFKAHYYLTASVPPQLAGYEYDEQGVKIDSVVPKICVALEDMFDICYKVHVAVGHSGRASMEVEAAKFYFNVTRTIIEIFLKYSKEYQIKKKRSANHGRVVKPIVSEYFNSRMQIDLVDFQSLPDGEHKWILNAQDHLTKFCHLRALKAKSASEVAWHLYQIFCEFGAPLILQSDNGKEFRNELISSLKLLWPSLEIVHGRARRPQTQGSVERANGDFQILLGSWMRTNKTTKWTVGLPLVQHQKNRKHNTGINSTPYCALFGHEVYNGLEIVTELSDAQCKSIKTAKELF